MSIRSNNKNGGWLRYTALSVALVFTVTSAAWATPVETAVTAGKNTSVAETLSLFTVPQELGQIESMYRGDMETTRDGRKDKARIPGRGERFVILIQDAHAIMDAQQNIQKLIAHFDKTCNVRLIAIEGARSKLDPTIFRSFPDAHIKKEVLSGYLKQGEITGAQMACIFNGNERVFSGIEDWKLYEANYRAYLQANNAKEALQAKWKQFKTQLDEARKAVYSAKLNEFQDHWEDFRAERVSLAEFLMYLVNYRKIFAQDPDLSELNKLIGSVGYATSRDQAKLEPLIKAMASEFKTKFVRGMGVRDEMNFYRSYQAFLTGKMECGQFLQRMIELGHDRGFQPKLTPALRRLLGHTETLSAIRGSSLYGELQKGLKTLERSLITRPEEKEIAEKYSRLFLLKDLISLELTHEQLSQYGKTPRDYLDLMADAAFREGLAPAVAFYHLALERDHAFYRNLAALMEDQKQSSAIVVAGGFHTDGLRRILEEKGIRYAVVTPRMSSLTGAENYSKVMGNEVSYKEYLKTTYYDAFVRHATQRLVGELNQPDFVRALKLWRDEVIRDLSRQGRVAEAGDYTRYLDALARVYVEKFGKGTAQSHEETLKTFSKEFNDFRDKSLDALWRRFETQLGQLTEGLKGLFDKKELTPASVTGLLENGGKPRPSMLGIRAVLDPTIGAVSAAPQRSETRSLVVPHTAGPGEEINVTDRGTKVQDLGLPVPSILKQRFPIDPGLKEWLKAYRLRLRDLVGGGRENGGLPEGVLFPNADVAYQMVRDAIGPLIKSKDEILEIGVGSGVVTGMLASTVRAQGVRDVHFVGTDINPLAIKMSAVMLRPYGNHVTLRKGDLFEPVRGRKFNIVFWNPPWFSEQWRERVYGVHMVDPEYVTVLRFLREVKAHLKPSGRLYLLFPVKYFGRIEAEIPYSFTLKNSYVNGKGLEIGLFEYDSMVLRRPGFSETPKLKRGFLSTARSLEEEGFRSVSVSLRAAAKREFAMEIAAAMSGPLGVTGRGMRSEVRTSVGPSEEGRSEMRAQRPAGEREEGFRGEERAVPLLSPFEREKIAVLEGLEMLRTKSAGPLGLEFTNLMVMLRANADHFSRMPEVGDPEREGLREILETALRLAERHQELFARSFQLGSQWGAPEASPAFEALNADFLAWIADVETFLGSEFIRDEGKGFFSFFEPESAESKAELLEAIEHLKTDCLPVLRRIVSGAPAVETETPVLNVARTLHEELPRLKTKDYWQGPESTLELATGELQAAVPRDEFLLALRMVEGHARRDFIALSETAPAPGKLRTAYKVEEAESGNELFVRITISRPGQIPVRKVTSSDRTVREVDPLKEIDPQTGLPWIFVPAQNPSGYGLDTELPFAFVLVNNMGGRMRVESEGGTVRYILELPRSVKGKQRHGVQPLGTAMRPSDAYIKKVSAISGVTLLSHAGGGHGALSMDFKTLLWNFLSALDHFLGYAHKQLLSEALPGSWQPLFDAAKGLRDGYYDLERKTMEVEADAEAKDVPEKIGQLKDDYLAWLDKLETFLSPDSLKDFWGFLGRQDPEIMDSFRPAAERLRDLYVPALRSNVLGEAFIERRLQNLDMAAALKNEVERFVTKVFWNGEGPLLDPTFGRELQVRTLKELLVMVVERIEENARQAMLSMHGSVPSEKLRTVYSLKQEIVDGQKVVKLTITNPGKIPDKLLEIDPATQLPSIFTWKRPDERRSFAAGGTSMPFAYVAVLNLKGSLSVRNVSDASDGIERVEFTIALPSGARSEARQEPPPLFFPTQVTVSRELPQSESDQQKQAGQNERLRRNLADVLNSLFWTPLKDLELLEEQRALIQDNAMKGIPLRKVVVNIVRSVADMATSHYGQGVLSIELRSAEGEIAEADFLMELAAHALLQPRRTFSWFDRNTGGNIVESEGAIPSKLLLEAMLHELKKEGNRQAAFAAIGNARMRDYLERFANPSQLQDAEYRAALITSGEIVSEVTRNCGGLAARLQYNENGILREYRGTFDSMRRDLDQRLLFITFDNGHEMMFDTDRPLLSMKFEVPPAQTGGMRRSEAREEAQKEISVGGLIRVDTEQVAKKAAAEGVSSMRRDLLEKGRSELRRIKTEYDQDRDLFLREIAGKGDMIGFMVTPEGAKLLGERFSGVVQVIDLEGLYGRLLTAIVMPQVFADEVKFADAGKALDLAKAKADQAVLGELIENTRSPRIAVIMNRPGKNQDAEQVLQMIRGLPIEQLIVLHERGQSMGSKWRDAAQGRLTPVAVKDKTAVPLMAQKIVKSLDTKQIMVSFWSQNYAVGDLGIYSVLAEINRIADPELKSLALKAVHYAILKFASLDEKTRQAIVADPVRIKTYLDPRVAAFSFFRFGKSGLELVIDQFVNNYLAETSIQQSA